MERRSAGNLRQRVREHLVPRYPDRCLHPGASLDVLDDRLLALGDHEHDVRNPRFQCLIHAILDEGPVHDRQHLLGDRLGCRQHPGAKAGCEDDRRADVAHAVIVVVQVISGYTGKVRAASIGSCFQVIPGSSLRKRSKVPPKPAPPEPRINERIRVPEVRLIDEEGRQVGVVKTTEALGMARERDVDLVEVAAQASPPVARLMDFGRFKYEQSKKEREAKKHQQNVQLREVRMKPKIDDHDIDFKTRTAAKLLKQGDKVKVTVMFRGREITHPQIGKALLDRVIASLDHIAMVEKDAMLEGRHMTVILAADKKKMAALARAAAAAAAAGEAPVEEEEDEAVVAAAAEAPVIDDDQDEIEEDDDAADDDVDIDDDTGD